MIPTAYKAWTRQADCLILTKNLQSHPVYQFVFSKKVESRRCVWFASHEHAGKVLPARAAAYEPHNPVNYASVSHAITPTEGYKGPDCASWRACIIFSYYTDPTEKGKAHRHVQKPCF